MATLPLATSTVEFYLMALVEQMQALNANIELLAAARGDEQGIASRRRKKKPLAEES